MVQLVPIFKSSGKIRPLTVLTLIPKATGDEEGYKSKLFGISYVTTPINPDWQTETYRRIPSQHSIDVCRFNAPGAELQMSILEYVADIDILHSLVRSSLGLCAIFSNDCDRLAATITLRMVRDQMLAMLCVSGIDPKHPMTWLEVAVTTPIPIGPQTR